MTKPNDTDWIPNIIIGQDYDSKYSDAPIHYDALNNMAVFFGRDMPVHRHAQYLQIHYFTAGETRFHIDEKIFHTNGPSCFLTPPSIPHSFLIDDIASGHVLTVHQSLIWRLLKDGLQQELNCDRITSTCIEKENLDKSRQKNWQLITQTFDNIREEWQTQQLGKSLVLQSLVRLLIVHMMRLSSQSVKSEMVNNDDLRVFHRFSDLIEEHYREHWHLPRYVEAIGISDSRLNQICQRIANLSPKKIIHDRMLLEIKRLLIFSNLTINDICYLTGFSDPAYFSRFFKKQVGETALEYRRSQG